MSDIIEIIRKEDVLDIFRHDTGKKNFDIHFIIDDTVMIKSII